MEEIPGRAQGSAASKCQMKGVQKGWSPHDREVQYCPGTKHDPEERKAMKHLFQFQYF